MAVDVGLQSLAAVQLPVPVDLLAVVVGVRSTCPLTLSTKKNCSIVVMCRTTPCRVVRRRGAARPAVERSAFAGFGFRLEVITVAVRWYLRYGLCYRGLEELLAERGVAVDDVSVYRRVQRFSPLFTDAARPLRHAAGDR